MRVPMESILPPVLGTQVEHIYISNHGQGGLSGRGGASPLDLSRPEFHPLFGRRSAQKIWPRSRFRKSRQFCPKGLVACFH